jgi:16S rRNA (guanine527-N7)-methyltransferase
MRDIDNASARQVLPESAAEVPPLGDGFTDAVARYATQLGISLEARQLAAIEAHARLLLAWNRYINLTAIRDPDAVALLHVADSLTAVHVLAGRGGSDVRLLDLGSGGGYPGLVLAAALPLGVVALLDSVAKKVRFLEVASRAVADALGSDRPQIAAIRARAEAFAHAREGRETWDVVAVRAVGSLAEIVELGMPLVRIGGELVAWKRDDPESARARDVEIENARAIIGATGGALRSVDAVDSIAPGLLPRHVLVRIDKVRSSPARYPRDPAQRRQVV